MQDGCNGCAQCCEGLPACLQNLGLAHVLCQAAAGSCCTCGNLGGHCLESVQSLLGVVLNVAGVGLQVVAQGCQVLATLCGALLELFEGRRLGLFLAACLALFSFLTCAFCCFFSFLSLLLCTLCLFLLQALSGHGGTFLEYAEVEEQTEDCGFGLERQLCLDLLQTDQGADCQDDEEDEGEDQCGCPVGHDGAEAEDCCGDQRNDQEQTEDCCDAEEGCALTNGDALGLQLVLCDLDFVLDLAGSEGLEGFASVDDVRDAGLNPADASKETLGCLGISSSGHDHLSVTCFWRLLFRTPPPIV